VGISVRATGEFKLKAQLNDLQDTWKNVNFVLKSYKDKQDAYVLTEIDVIYQFLDEGQAAINMILGNRFVKSMRTEADNFRKNLLTLSNAVEEWIKVQQAWMYLENIFQSADIKKQLGSTVSKFEAVDKYFKALMIKTQKSSNCIKIVKTTY
jgi:dynein heavy chain, axonemal